MIKVARKTMLAMDAAILADQGTAYRAALQDILPKMDDAYRPTADRHRSHFGFSNVGEECDRKLWFSWKWALAKMFPARILRLFNRGHLEEARFLAMLKAAKFDVFFETEEGGQFKIEDFNGHAGSALDGVVIGLPDLPPDIPALVEMKTHSEKSFKKLTSVGLEASKWVHYVQMQIYMHKYSLAFGLYMAVNKNDDDVYCEIVEINPSVAIKYIDRVGAILYSDEAPPRLSETPAWYECKYCDYIEVCHGDTVPEINCRTCCHSTPVSNKDWHCSLYNVTLTKENQLSGCDAHLFNPNLLSHAKVLEAEPNEGWIRISWQDQDVKLGGVDGMTSLEFKEANAEA